MKQEYENVIKKYHYSLNNNSTCQTPFMDFLAGRFLAYVGDENDIKIRNDFLMNFGIIENFDFASYYIELYKGIISIERKPIKNKKDVQLLNWSKIFQVSTFSDTFKKFYSGGLIINTIKTDESFMIHHFFKKMFNINVPEHITELESYYFIERFQDIIFLRCSIDIDFIKNHFAEKDIEQSGEIQIVSYEDFTSQLENIDARKWFCPEINEPKSSFDMLHNLLKNTK